MHFIAPTEDCFLIIFCATLSICCRCLPPDVFTGLLRVGEGAPAGGGNVVTVHEGLGETLTGFQLRSLRQRAETRHAGGRQIVHDA